ncbi:MULTISPECIES: MSMEG_4193 family putative phosphomutase [unclassified Luteococcus]|uniref:MSMEG_4193 family putative phosphomutase n=1 Tax=unclassified Luteococcus TaxID=2639923 RepID=UPI00313F1BA6
MTILLLVRHGRSTSNAAGTLAGRAPGIALDQQGESQAMGVGERLRGVRLAAAVHSPLQRCRQTLELALASGALDVPVTEDGRFTECGYGDWTGRSLAELAAEPLWRRVQAEPSRVRFPDGESMAEMAERMVSGVANWNRRLGQAQPDGEPVWLLVSHGDPIKALLSDALGQRLDDFQRIVVDPASVSIIHYPSDQQRAEGRPPMVLAMNTTAGQLKHRLPGAPAGPELGGGLGTSA